MKHCYLPAYGKLKTPKPYMFDGLGVSRFNATIVDMVALTEKGVILYDDIMDPDIKPWFLVRIQGFSNYDYWARRILTDGKVFHNKISYRNRINRRYRTRANKMNESNRLALVQAITEFVTHYFYDNS